MGFFNKTDKAAAQFTHVVFYSFVGVIVGIVLGLFFGFVIGWLTQAVVSDAGEMVEVSRFLGMGAGAVIGSVLGGASALKK